MLVAKLKSVPVMPRSFSSVPWRACARLDRSRKFSRYMMTRKGRRCKSILRRSFLVCWSRHAGAWAAKCARSAFSWSSGDESAAVVDSLPISIFSTVGLFGSLESILGGGGRELVRLRLRDYDDVLGLVDCCCLSYKTEMVVGGGIPS